MTTKQESSNLGCLYRIKVTLKGSSPPIWRRLEVSDQTTLAKLHRILQVAMGWTNSHLHQFIIGKTYYVEHDDDGFSRTLSEERVKLHQLPLKEKSKFIYEYDFGDSWEHVILIEKILPVTEGDKPPVCLKGKGACPPEDIGGLWGYYEFLEAIGDPGHPEHENMLEWGGEDFDPEAFAVAVVNQYLAKIS